MVASGSFTESGRTSVPQLRAFEREGTCGAVKEPIKNTKLYHIDNSYFSSFTERSNTRLLRGDMQAIAWIMAGTVSAARDAGRNCRNPPDAELDRLAASFRGVRARWPATTVEGHTLECPGPAENAPRCPPEWLRRVCPSRQGRATLTVGGRSTDGNALT